MLRDIMTNTGKVADATYSAGTDLVRGMVVVKSNGNTAFATAPTGDNVFFVDKEPIPAGVDSVRGELSDYDSSFENIKSGEKVVLKNYVAGETIATDQIDSSVTKGVYLEAGTDGKLAAAGVDVITKMICGGDYDDNGHSLKLVEFVQ